MSIGLTEDILKRIGTIPLQRYAVLHGWERQTVAEKFKIALYRRPEDPTRELILPQSEEFGDYFERIADFIRGLASFESVSADQVLNAALNPHADVLRFGYQAPEANYGFVPFLKGIHLYDAALRSLSTATYDVLKPEKFHLRMGSPSAEKYIESCRMGQTERGSFVISCICPVEPSAQLSMKADDEQLVDEIPALGRRVTQHIMNSVAQINEFVLADKANRLVEPESGDIIISGNFFESLLAFPVEQEAASLYIKAEWDRSLDKPRAPQRTEVRYDMFTAIDDVARQLRPTKISKQDRFVARVISLRGEANSQEQMEGEVVLVLLDLDTSTKARVQLTPDDYSLACDAHKMNKYVSIVGTLSRFRKTNQIEDYTNFQMLPD